MGEPTLSDGGSWLRWLLPLALPAGGFAAAFGLDEGEGAGELVRSIVSAELTLAGVAALVALVRWAIQPGDRALARADRAKVNRAVRSGASIDEVRLAPAVTKRAGESAQRLWRYLSYHGRLRNGWVAIFVVEAVGNALGGDPWQAGFAVLCAGFVVWQRPNWDAIRIYQRERALAAGEAAWRLLPPPSPTPPTMPTA